MLVILAIVGAIAGIAGVAVAVVAHNRVNQVVDECTEALRRQLQIASTGIVDNQALRDLAIVHYDALREMSGRRSFSVALINAAGDGVVLSSINGRTETRTYAKVVRGGRGVELLSPEEDQALRAARLGKGPVVDMDDPLPDFGRAPVVPAPANGAANGAANGHANGQPNGHRATADRS